MRKIKTIFTLLILASFSNLYGQLYYMAKPEGFGAAATGGGTAAATTVTSESAFKTAATKSGAGVILVSGKITFSALMKIVVKDKTIIGLPGARFVNNVQTKAGSGILYLQDGSSNVIIRNLIFEGPGAYDVDGNDNLCADGATKLWVDHCEFQDGMDGNFDNKGNTDNVTISWCKFTYLKAPKAGGSGGTDDHRYTDLVGSSASNYPADGHYSITFQNCYWAEGCKERMPRARNAELHILNCYYSTSVANSLAIGLGGGDKNLTCYAENTDFAKISQIYRSYDSGDGGSHTLTFSGCLKGGSNVGTTTKPSYKTSVFPVANVATAITGACGAGATLKVTAAGVISSACITTDIEATEEIASATVVYPNPSSGVFTIQGKHDIKSIAILNANGETVFTKDNIAFGVHPEINTELAEGVYLVKILNENGSTEVVKFLRTK